MKPRTIELRRWRIILDCVLVLLVVLLAVAGYRPARAGDDRQAFSVSAPVADSTALRDSQSATARASSVNPSPDQPLLDNNTLAEIIAAENAALTLPQYLVDLPMVSR